MISDSEEFISISFHPEKLNESDESASRDQTSPVTVHAHKIYRFTQN